MFTNSLRNKHYWLYFNKKKNKPRKELDERSNDKKGNGKSFACCISFKEIPVKVWDGLKVEFTEKTSKQEMDHR